MLLLLLPLAAAGYGDQVDGYPSWAERWTFLWTNAARVAPTEWEEEYATGGCSVDRDFSEDEKTPKDPLYLDYALSEVARFHSEDMADNGCFQHESCDGTDTWVRIGGYYSETSNLGENIAYAADDGRFAVLSMWMCSHSGHRANIMNGGFNELGVGFGSSGGYNYYTQDFAGGSLLNGTPPVRMAADDGRGVFYADWGDESAPARMDLVVDGETVAMDLSNGTEERGLWFAQANVSGCKPWWIAWKTAAGVSGTFPEVGAYQAGTCDKDYLPKKPSLGADEEEGGGSSGPLLGTGDGNDIHLTGCATATSGGWWGLLGVVALLRRRSRS